MSFAGAWKEGDGDFLLVVSGTTRYAPYLAGWQEFKDHLRKVVKEQPGWANVYSSQGQRKGEMEGWCRLKDREDADAVYKVYCRARGMLVHVWETSRKGDGYRLMRCNCSTTFPEIPDGGHFDGRGIDFGRISQLGGGGGGGGGRTAPATPAPYLSAQSSYPYLAYPQTPVYPPQQQPGYAPIPVYSAFALSSPPVYSATTNGIPVNVRGGAILTEARGIFIRNLSYKCTMEELNALLAQTVGYPIDIQFIRDSRTGAFRGAATAKFASKELAQHAAARLNGKVHKGMMLEVRMDTDTTVVGQAEPMVVNGSYTASLRK